MCFHLFLWRDIPFSSYKVTSISRLFPRIMIDLSWSERPYFDKKYQLTGWIWHICSLPPLNTKQITQRISKSSFQFSSGLILRLNKGRKGYYLKFLLFNPGKSGKSKGLFNPVGIKATEGLTTSSSISKPCI